MWWAGPEVPLATWPLCARPPRPSGGGRRQPRPDPRGTDSARRSPRGLSRAVSAGDVTGTCLLPSRGYATKHVVEGLEPRTLYRFRLKVTSPSGEYEYSPVVSVSTTSEYAHTRACWPRRKRPSEGRGQRSALGRASPDAATIPSETLCWFRASRAWPPGSGGARLCCNRRESRPCPAGRVQRAAG